MSWTPNLDFQDDIKVSWEIYETEEDYGLNQRSIRPGKTPLNSFQPDDEEIDVAPDAMAELQLDAYRRKLGYTKKTEKTRWADPKPEEESEDFEIVQMIRNTGSDREPKSNPLNSSTTSKTAIPVDKYVVSGMKNHYFTADRFKFDNVYFHSKQEKEDQPVKDNCSIPEETVETESDTVGRKTFIQPKMGAAGEQYVSPARLYALKARRNR